MSLKPINLLICGLQVAFFLYLFTASVAVSSDQTERSVSEGFIFFLGTALLIFCIPALIVCMFTRFQAVGLIMSLVFPAGAIFLFLSGVA